MKRFALLLLLIFAGISLVWSQGKKTSFTTFEQSFINQTATIGPVTLFTPAVDEDFEVSMYLQNVSPQNSTVVATISWDDGVQPAPGTPPVQQSVNSAGSHGAISFPIHVAANTPVTLMMTDSGSGQTYNFHVTALGF